MVTAFDLIGRSSFDLIGLSKCRIIVHESLGIDFSLVCLRASGIITIAYISYYNTFIGVMDRSSDCFVVGDVECVSPVLRR